MGIGFIGRDRELAELLAGLQDALRGRGSVFLIVGEPGIGKTALAQELARRAADSGARVLWGRGWAGGGAPPYWPWSQIMEALVEGTDEEALRPHLAAGARHLAVLAPRLAERMGAGEAPSGSTDSEAARFYLFEATSRFLREVSALQPLTLVLDDILVGDRPSLLLLRFLAREVRSGHLLVLATCRTTETTQSAEAAEAVADLVRDGHLLRLDGLDRGDTGQLVAQLSGRQPWTTKLTAIHEATEGNPLFVREVTRLLGAAEVLERPGRLSIPIPESIRAVIGRRLAPLSADAVAALSAAAVVGRDFDLPLVCAACQLPAERVLASLSDALRQGIVTEQPEGIGVYRFSHPLMREVIYEGLPLGARLQMHRQVGEAIEQLHASDSGSHFAELALHFTRAATGGEREKAARYARCAGDRAMGAYAYEEAAQMYRRALEALEPARGGDAERCELLLRLGGAQARAGDYPEAKASYLRAAELARALAATEPFARAALGFGEPQVDAGLVDRQLIALLQEALDRLSPEDSALRALVLSRLSLELTFSPEAGLRESLSQQAVEMGRRLGEVAALATALRARWMALWGPAGLTERAALAEEMLGLALETGDREMELIARVRRMTCTMEAGDLRAAESDLAAHARLVGELRMPYHEWTAATLRAGQALLSGSLDAAEELADAARMLLPGRQSGSYAYLTHVTPIRWEQGRLAELRALWQTVAEQFPQAGFARGWLSLAAAEVGQEEAAARELRALVDALPGLPRHGLWLPTLALAALAAARLEDGDAAACVYPLVAPHLGATIIIPMPQPVMCFGSAALYAGLLAATLARYDEAADHFETALRANERLGATAFLARTRCEYAHLLLRRGGPGDRRRALGLLDRAAATAAPLGLVALDQRIEQLRQRAAGAGRTDERRDETGLAPAAERGADLFRREGDYWTVVYEGSLVRLPDSKGLRCLARLLASPGQEILALDLEAADGRAAHAAPARSGRVTGAADLELRADLGDAGELLDAQARAAYKARLEELREELEEAESFHDPARAARAREEMDFLTRELARAVGLGGRDRKAASHAERARLNVTRAIRAAMKALERAHPTLGQHLSLTIRTGRYCSYRPDPRSPITWSS